MPKLSEPFPETSEEQSQHDQEIGNLGTAQLQALASLTSYLQKQIKDLVDKQNAIYKEFQRQEDRLLRVENKIDENRTQLIETLGLFIALFTFISIEFSIFKEVNVFSAAVSLTLIAAGLLIFFVLLLHVLLRTGKNWQSYALYLLLIISTMGLIYFGINFSNYYLKTDYPLRINPSPTATPSGTLVPL